MSISQSLTSTKKAERPLFGRELSTYIEVSPETVFHYIADISRHGEWSADPLEITQSAGSDHGPGATFTTLAHVGKNTIAAQVCIIAEEPPVRFIYEGKDLFGHHRWTMTLRAEGNGTCLTQRMERVQGPLWVRLLQPYILWPTAGRRSVGKGLARIKSRLEAEA